MVHLELALTNDLARLLELHVSVATHPLLESLLKSRPFLRRTLAACLDQQSDGNRLSIIRLLGILLTPAIQQLIRKSHQDDDHLSGLLEMFLTAVDEGNLG